MVNFPYFAALYLYLYFVFLTHIIVLLLITVINSYADRHTPEREINRMLELPLKQRKSKEKIQLYRTLYCLNNMNRCFYLLSEIGISKQQYLNQYVNNIQKCCLRLLCLKGRWCNQKCPNNLHDLVTPKKLWQRPLILNSWDVLWTCSRGLCKYIWMWKCIKGISCRAHLRLKYFLLR